MVKAMKINFVMSEDKQSGILRDFIQYFKNFMPPHNELIITNEPDLSCDVFHYHRPNICKHIEGPSLTTVHHDPKDTDRWLDWSNFHPKYLNLDHIVCLNSAQKNFLISQGFNNNKISVIPHGYNPDLMSMCKNRLTQHDSKFTLGIISKRYGRRVKGEAYLLELSKRIDTDKFKFLLVGENRDITAVELENFGFEVQSFDYMPYKMIASFYAKIDALLVTSIFEGGPANLPEALVTRTPVFTTPVGMAPDVIVEGVNGYFLTGNYCADSQLIMDSTGCFEKISSVSLDNVPTWRDVVLRYTKIYDDLHRARK